MTTVLSIIICIVLALLAICSMYLVYEKKEIRRQIKKFSELEVKKDELKETLNTGHKIDNLLNSLDLLNNRLDKLPNDKK